MANSLPAHSQLKEVVPLMSHGVSQRQLLLRLEKLEREELQRRALESEMPIRERSFLIKTEYVRGMTRKYLWAKQFIGRLGGSGFSYEARNVGALNKLRSEGGIELIHLCMDFEVFFESLAWCKENEVTEEGKLKKQVYKYRELEGYTEYAAAKKLRISRRRTRKLWEECIEDLWEKLEDYDESRTTAWL